MKLTNYVEMETTIQTSCTLGVWIPGRVKCILLYFPNPLRSYCLTTQYCPLWLMNEQYCALQSWWTYAYIIHVHCYLVNASPLTVWPFTTVHCSHVNHASLQAFYPCTNYRFARIACRWCRNMFQINVLWPNFQNLGLECSTVLNNSWWNPAPVG